MTKKSAELIPAAGHVGAAVILALSEAAHEADAGAFQTPIGTTPVAWRGDSSRLKDTPILDFVLETERKVSGADLASSAAFATDAVLGPGQVTGAQIAHLYPYDNTLSSDPHQRQTAPRLSRFQLALLHGAAHRER